MSAVTQDIAALLSREVGGLQRELELFPDDASIWQTIPGVTNSSGTLALHLAGNLQHYVGAVLGGSDYVRTRPEEFGRRTGSRAELIAELETAARVVNQVLPGLPEDRLDRPYPETVLPGVELTTRRFLLHLCAHAAFHLGQAGYLRRMATGNAESSGALSLRRLADTAVQDVQPTPLELEPLIDPELRPILAATPPFGDITADPPATRKRLAEMLAAAGPAESTERVGQEDRGVPGSPGAPAVPVRIYAPATSGPRCGALLWMHGGGLVLGDLDQDDTRCRHIVDRTGAVVVSVGYRLAPEAPFPAGVDDCFAALRWMHAAREELRVPADRLAVGGASAGGCLAAAVALMARDRGGPPLALQLLIYPMLDDRHATASSQVVTDPRVWSRGNSVKAWRAYLGDAIEVSPYAAPARAHSLAGLPPAYMMVADPDLLRDENLDYARRLIAAGVPTELHLYAGTLHGFDVLAPSATISRRAVNDYIATLTRTFGA